ncbi:MAG: hypothetical protein QOD99_1385 [Chthoniobacter sp.]|jgi:glycosyltransferase involved in cell wall biosynthesis|nr:hypothetical protein [Chthoniobacter sp.]
MTRSGLATIVISSYNYARYLSQAIESALNQSWREMEVIVVDDGSKDHSVEVIASYGERITPLLKENGGQGSVLNAGFLQSRGDIICFLDSDDILLPTAVEKAVELFTDGKASKVHWPLVQIDSEGKQGATLLKDLAEGDLRDAVISGGPDSYSSPPTSGNAWTRAYLENVLPLTEGDWKTCPDAYLELLAPFFGEIRKVIEPQTLYRIHGRNHLLSTPYLERVRMFDKRCQILREFLRARGILIDPEQWATPGYLWWKRLISVGEEIEPFIPRGGSFILVDENEFGQGQLVPGRHAYPFLEKDDQYWGPPKDDVTAITELKRLREKGADLLVFAWPAFWWRDHYTEFASYLGENFPCLLSNERLIIYDLHPRTGDLNGR